MRPQRIVDDRYRLSGAKRAASENTPEEDMPWEGRHCRSINSETRFIAKGPRVHPQDDEFKATRINGQS